MNLCVFLSGTKNIKEHDERIREHLQGRLQHARKEHLEGEAMPCRGFLKFTKISTLEDYKEENINSSL